MACVAAFDLTASERIDDDTRSIAMTVATCHLFPHPRSPPQVAKVDVKR
jgi:hypothetical protein